MSTATGLQQESKRQRFLRLGNNRLETALNAIRLLENLLRHPYIYQYNQNDVEKISKEITGRVERLKAYSHPQKT